MVRDNHDDRTEVPACDPRPKHRDTCVVVQDSDWVWVPIVVMLIFLIALMMGRKVRRFDGKSTRMKLMEYISIDPLLNTMHGASHHHRVEQRKIELGHQSLSGLALVLLLSNYITNADTYRWIFYVPCAIQIGLWLLNLIVDLVLIRAFGSYGVRSVRSVNTKLRFAHCTYQVVLFCVDFLKGSGIITLPPDCYIWATTHYSYEAIGLLLEGLNVIGLSEFVIIVLVNAAAMKSSSDSNGTLLAFGVTCIVLSCASLIVAIPFKVWNAIRLSGDPASSGWAEDDSAHAHDGDTHLQKDTRASASGTSTDGSPADRAAIRAEPRASAADTETTRPHSTVEMHLLSEGDKPARYDGAGSRAD